MGYILNCTLTHRSPEPSIMFATTVHAIVVIGSFLFLFLLKFGYLLLRYVRHRATIWILKHLVNAVFIRRSNLFPPITRWFVLLTLLYWLGTAACNVFGVSSLADAGNRAGQLSVVNFVPLLLVNRLAFGADLLGLPRRTFHLIHGSIGFMTILQTLIHLIGVLNQRPFDPGNQQQLYGLLVSVSPSWKSVADSGKGWYSPLCLPSP
jgi:hypothetical protein